ncbi:[acyl-carrier-protein] S-malonyltransferase [Nocardia tenerifensis]|uniref:[acyl-carrier-protein] S-malonyltransferase n=1 Tax=Nocardia tenerifensis TaxID=228006 RepID=A0A318KH22_9NOCA|nr:ACP S-malonyltransferase [Nocardia tenerifensis]PXX71473.1 [acyl-carrier-protein] S-malonyltransferase [Nocardia tenerifensis]
MDIGRNAESAIVFPGMGPTAFGDVAKFMVVNSHARKLLAEADAVLGYSLFDRYRETPGDYTEFAQVAFLVNCLALAEGATGTLDAPPRLCVGPSFGGKAAAVHVGSLTFAEAVWMTSRWARCLDEYFAVEQRDVVTQSFARTPEPVLAEALAELDARGEWYELSCYVDDDFYLVTLHEDSAEALRKRLRSMGGLPLYAMRPPMHASVFGPLRDRVEEEVFGRLAFADPAVAVVADQDGSVLRTGAQIRDMLLAGFVRPVRWPRVVETLRDNGIGTLLVCGQDSMFTRVGCTTRNFEVAAVNPRTALRPRRRIAS